MRCKLCELILKNAAVLFLSMIWSFCGRESVFTAPVVMISEPDEIVEVSVEKIPTDYLYSEFFAVYDTILISARPNDTDYNFYVSSIKNNKLLGSFMRHGQGPGEYTGMTPIKRIERKGDDLIALTYGPHKMQVAEWNISQSISTGKDSLLLGNYKNANEYGYTYSEMYRIGESEYLGYTTGFSPYESSEVLLPTYWILERQDTVVPVNGISVVKDVIDNEESVVPVEGFFSSFWSLSPDNSKIFSAMCWLKQVNIIDLNDNSVRSYRVEGSPDESIFDTNMENAVYQYRDVVCYDDRIYALYSGKYTFLTTRDIVGFQWIHEFDWDGNFVRKYHLPVPVSFIQMDPATGTIYGYSFDDDNVIYKVNLPSQAER